MLYNLPQDKIIEIFGHGFPKDHEIQAYKDMMWRQSVHYRRDIKRTIIPHRIPEFLDTVGLYTILDDQFRDRQVRFSREEILVQALLAGFDDFVVVTPSPADWPGL